MALSDRLAFLITADGAQAIATFGEVAAAARKAGEEASGAGGGLGAIGTAAAVAGVGVAGAAIGKFAEDSIKHFEDAAGAVLKFQRIAGGTAESASQMVSVFRVLGIDTDAAATAMFRLGREAESGGVKLASVGVGVAKTKDGAVDLIGTLGNVADAYRNAGSAAERDTILFDAFGRGGQALLPMLAQNKDALAALFAEARANGEIFSQKQLDQAKNLKIEMGQLGQEFHKLEDVIGSHLVPLVERFFSGLERVGVAFHLIKQSDLDAAAAQAQFASDTANATAKLNEQTKAADTAATESRTFRDSLVAVVDTSKAVADAEAKVADARTAGITKAKDLETAERGLEDANRSVAAAAIALQDAEATAFEKPLRDALALHAATFAVTDAQKAYNIAVAQYGRNSEEAAKAADAITAAELNKHDTQRKAAEPDTTVQTAKDALRAANDRVATAQEAINKAEREDPARILADAEDTLARAVNAHADAQDKAKTAVDKSKLSTDELRSSFDTMIAGLVAAGVDPATIQVFRNIEGAALAARFAIDDLTKVNNDPSLVGPVAGRQTQSSDVGPNFDPATGKVKPGVVGPVAGRETQTSSVTYDYSVHVTVPPGTDAHGVAAVTAMQQTTRK